MTLIYVLLVVCLILCGTLLGPLCYLYKYVNNKLGDLKTIIDRNDRSIRAFEIGQLSEKDDMLDKNINHLYKAVAALGDHLNIECNKYEAGVKWQKKKGK